MKLFLGRELLIKKIETINRVMDGDTYILVHAICITIQIYVLVYIYKLSSPSLASIMLSTLMIWKLTFYTSV